ncbi:hypothetical protein ACMZ6Y_07090 [Streptococcus pluranimalium]|uniref:hypothetical protein n=1 Tax=Streptococcus hyovaginalis TaxID=149015 RepID=UPI002A82A4FE|nr:hypothetical protein [Streptococcus hyovaginalis]MDY4511543.1 hypothetical protein [Streptococcus hyovaginalis]
MVNVELQKELKENLLEWYDNQEIKNTEKFLTKYSPWNREEGTQLAQNFLDILKYNKEINENFSWFDIDKKYEEQGLKESDKAPANMHYGIPNQIQGDIDESGLFLCLSNPNIAVEDKYKSKDIGIADYYKYFSNLDKLDETSNFNNFKDANEIINHIVNLDENIISYEFNNFISSTVPAPKNINGLKNEIKLKTYYIPQYFKNLLSNDFYNELLEGIHEENNSIEKIKTIFTNLKVCNLESYPFRSKAPMVSRENSESIGNKILSSSSDVTLLSSRIIIRRITKYLASDCTDIKPYFCFRRYNDLWINSLRKSLKEITLENESSCAPKSNLILDYFENNFFYYVGGKDNNKLSKGLISEGNLSRNNGKIDKGNKDFQKLRESAGINGNSIFKLTK